MDTDASVPSNHAPHNFDVRKELPIEAQLDLDHLALNLQRMSEEVVALAPPLVPMFHFLGQQVLTLRRDLLLHVARKHADD